MALKAKYCHLLFDKMSIRAAMSDSNGNELVIIITMHSFTVNRFESDKFGSKQIGSKTIFYTIETLDSDLDNLPPEDGRVFIRWLIKGLHGTPLEVR